MAIYFKLGSFGENVVRIQTMLNYLRMPQVPLKTDGQFGPKTKAGVVQFQAKTLLVADGVVGPITGGRLTAAVLSRLARP
jgi:peptidoglycan hydrolase-like protein with peptidoglycan-binding domain